MVDPDVQIRGGGGGAGHPDPEIRGGTSLKKKIFSALWASVWSKNKNVGPCPGSATGIVPDIT